MYEDLIKQDENWKPTTEQQTKLDNLKWQASLSFCLHLDTPDHDLHSEKEAHDYILLLLTVLQDIKEGDHQEDKHSIEKLENLFDEWETFYHSFNDFCEDDETI